MTTATAIEQDVYRTAFERQAAAPGAAAEPAELAAARRRAIERFAELGFPTPRLEEWRSTNVAPIAGTDFDLDPSGEGVTAAEISHLSYADAHELVFVNGCFSPELSRLEGLPEGVFIGPMSRALEAMPERLARHLARHASFESHAFVALNTALFRDGAVVWIPRNTVVEKPVNLIHVGRPAAQAPASFPRFLLVAEESSQVTVVEQYATVGKTSEEGDGVHFTCPVTEVVVGANAVIDHYKIERESTDAFHMATLDLYQERDGNFSSHSISWGGALVRNDVNAILDGEGGETTLNGLYMVEGTQLVDNHMRVEHAKPHCDSHELYKGILEGKARAVFNGRIYVHKGAQKTDAKQTNRNLLLSPEALCNSNPQLEIFADDVRCTHGSTVGQLDDTAVFYLRSRGIGEEAARSLLTYAFAADIVGRIKVGEVRRDLEEFLFRRLPRGEVVRQAV